ncbi:hypothetical protein SOPP22_01360 [Shewanella sp. OPT22]|nr:hypothetical protein SOPP22_01360 [Shewanella sp. OPT22]
MKSCLKWFLLACFVISSNSYSITDDQFFINKAYRGNGEFILSVFDPESKYRTDGSISSICDVEFSSSKSTTLSSQKSIQPDNWDCNQEDKYKWYRVLQSEPKNKTYLGEFSGGYVSGLLPIGEYTFSVHKCYGSNCQEKATIDVSVQAINSPSSLGIKTPSSTSAQLSWTPSSFPSLNGEIIVEQRFNGGGWRRVFSGLKTDVLLSTPYGKYEHRTKACSFGACSDYTYFEQFTQEQEVSAGVIKELDYELYQDEFGNFYLKPPKQFVLISGEINIPLLLESKEPVLMLVYRDGNWVLLEINASQLKFKTLTPVTGHHLNYRDYDGDGRIDFGLHFNSVSEHPGLVILDINSPFHSIVGINNDGEIDENFEADVKPTEVTNPLDGTDNGVVVGSIPNEVKVTSMGTASYTIPIEQAPGTAGLVPNLSLQYDSSAENGWLGVGWNINGVSVISRCAQNKEQNGNARAVSFTSSDRFCLDGKKLFLSSDSTGTYGSEGSKYRFETNNPIKIELTKVDNNGPSEFTVSTNDGSKIIYKAINVATTQSHFLSGEPAIAWPIYKKQDAYNNEIVYEFERDSEFAISYRLKNVTYANGLNNIEFEYEDRPDHKMGYTAGFEFNINKRLKKVYSKVNSQELRTYQIEYIQSTTSNRSLIESIESSRGSSKLPKTVFDWQQGNFDFRPQHKYSNNENDSYHNTRVENVLPYLILDMNGDGKTDYWKIREDSDSDTDDIIFVLGGEFFSQYDYFEDYADKAFRKSAEIIDVDNDGRDDVIFQRNGKWHLFYSEVDANNPYEINYNMDSPINTNISVINRKIKIADFNSDGYADFAYANDGSVFIHYNEYKTNGIGSFSDAVTLSIDGLSESMKDPIGLNLGEDLYFKEYFRVVDFDNDGESEFLIGMRNGASGTWKLYDTDGELLNTFGNFDVLNWCCYVYLGASTQEKSDTSVWVSLRTADLNSDGLKDILYTRYVNDTFTDAKLNLYVKYNRGSGLFSNEILLNEVRSTRSYKSGTGGASVSGDYQLVDFDSDGYVDILTKSNASNDYWSVYYSNGHGTDAAQVTDVPYTTGIINQFVDVNGDGNSDYISLYGRLSNWRSASPIRDVITDVTDGFENTTSFFYRTITSTGASSFYVRDVDGAEKNWGNGSPVVDVTAPIKVVTRLTTPKSYVTYQYRGLKAQHGRGMLGFAEVSNYEQQSSTRRIATYNQAFPYTGLLHTTETYYAPVTETIDPPEPPPCIECEPCDDVDCQHPKVAQPLSSVSINNVNDEQSDEPVLLASSEVEYNISSSNGFGFVYPWRQTSSKFDLKTGASLSYQTKVNTDLDDWGNIGREVVRQKRSRVSVGEKITTTINDYDYFDHTGGRLKQRTVNYTGTARDQIIQQTHYEYDDNGLLETEEVNGSKGSGSSANDISGGNYYLKTTLTRDVYGNIESKLVEGDGIEAQFTDYKYDDYGRYVVEEGKYKSYPSTTDIFVSEYEYHPVFGGQTLEVNPNGLRAVSGYSQLGRLNFVFAPNGTYTTIDQQLCDSSCVSGAYYQQITSNSHSGDKVEFFDEQGRKLAERNQIVQSYNGNSLNWEWQWQRYRYDRKGRVTATSIPHFTSELNLEQLAEGSDIDSLPNGYMGVKYDELDRQIETTDANGNKWLTSYDGYIVTETDPDNRSKIKEINAYGELVKSTDVEGNELRYGYDAMSNLITVSRDAPTGAQTSNEVVTYNYFDHLGRKVRMIDPDKGTIEYKYDVLGNVIWQEDNKNQITTTSYDALLRPTSRIRQFADGSTDQSVTWEYDEKDFGLGLVSSVTDNINGITQDYEYHWLSKVKQNITTFGSGQNATRYVQKTYFYGPENAYQTKTSFDATGYGVSHRYADNVLVEKTNLRNNKQLWEFSEADAWGNTTEFRLGNGHTTTHGYDELTGNMSSIQTGDYNQIQNISLDFDKYGDLEYRWDHLNNVKEEFDYDNLHRLTFVDLTNYSGTARTEVRYDELGNITFKTGVGSYHYETNRPHAVSRISAGDLAGSFNYDANGNMTSGGGRDQLVYNTVDKPTLIRAGSTKTEFDYGFDGVRFKRTDTTNSTHKETIYIGNVEFTRTNGITTLVQRHLGGVAVELDYYGSNRRTEFNYLYRDHLGSVTVMTDINGNITKEYSYDVWGQRRPLDTGISHPLQQLNRATIFAHNDFNRGFTGHEHIDELGIIHMNGRVYDPRLARFLSVDPIVADGTDLQTYNRYSYVRNNPLNAVDPSGYNPVAIIANFIAALVVANTTIQALQVAYFIYTIYSAVEAIYSAVQSFKYGDGNPFAVFSAVMAVYSVYTGANELSKSGNSAGKGTDVEGVKSNQTDSVPRNPKSHSNVPLEDISNYSEPELFADDGFATSQHSLTAGKGARRAPIGNSQLQGVVNARYNKVYNQIRELDPNFSVARRPGVNRTVNQLRTLETHLRTLKGAPPISETPLGGGHGAAHRAAKRSLNIPKNMQPTSVQPNINRAGRLEPGTVEIYRLSNGQGGFRDVFIRHDVRGGFYGTGNFQNIGPHYNTGTVVNGQFQNTSQHFIY